MMKLKTYIPFALIPAASGPVAGSGSPCGHKPRVTVS